MTIFLGVVDWANGGRSQMLFQDEASATDWHGRMSERTATDAHRVAVYRMTTKSQPILDTPGVPLVEHEG